VRFGNPKDSLSDFRTAGSRIAKLFPVIKPAASDYIVDRCKCPFRVSQMTVQHSFWSISRWHFSRKTAEIVLPEINFN
jgi:hypothetical protein